MLTKEEIVQNKETFIELVKSIKREDIQVEKLLNTLERSDFFTAPASTEYHSNFEGGLCLHSLNVYNQLKKVIDMEYPKMIPDEFGELKENEIKCPYDEDTIKIVALFHDFSKMNFYDLTTRNVKDEEGNWTQVPYYRVKDAKNRFLYSHHGANSEYMTQTFIPLKLEESIAIIHHMGWSDDHINKNAISEIYNKYPLALYLHIADCLSTFVQERI